MLRAGQCCSFSFWQRWCPSPSPLSASSAPLNMNLTVLILLKGSAQTIMLYPLTFTLYIVSILLQPKIQLPVSRLLGLDKLSHCGRQVLTNICFHNYLLFTNICFRKLCSLFELFSYRGYLIRNCSRQVGEIQVAMLNNFVLLIKKIGLILNQAKYKNGCHYWGQEKVFE